MSVPSQSHCGLLILSVCWFTSFPFPLGILFGVRWFGYTLNCPHYTCSICVRVCISTCDKMKNQKHLNMFQNKGTSNKCGGVKLALWPPAPWSEMMWYNILFFIIGNWGDYCMVTFSHCWSCRDSKAICEESIWPIRIKRIVVRTHGNGISCVDEDNRLAFFGNRGQFN